MSASGHTLARHRLFYGAIALLVVMLLRCGIGAIGLISDARDLDSSYPDTAILAEQDSAEDDTTAKHAGGKGLAVFDTDFTPPMVAADARRPAMSVEGQVASILNGGIQCAVRPTGPPHARA